MLSRSRYLDLKAEHNGALLLFVVGNYYELFHEDAWTAATAIGLTVSQRTKKDSTPVTGFPHWGLETHLKTLHDAN